MPKARALLRALHRDIGYFAVGLTFIYALSGLAVNHIADWDPSFSQVEHRFTLARSLPPEPEAAAQVVLEALGRNEKPTDVYPVSDNQLDIVLPLTTLHVDRAQNAVFEEGQKPRPFLRLANWLHLNRGKKAWTYFADAYAVFLLFLASSGLFMIAGRRGLFWRGLLIAGLGTLIPIGYIALSGGP